MKGSNARNTLCIARGTRTALLAAVLCGMLAAPLMAADTAREPAPLPPAAVDIASKNRNPPRYPPEAFRAGAEGEVLVQVMVDANGSWADARVTRSSGSALLDAAAVEATRRWSYIAAQHDGTPVAGAVQIPVVFALH